MVRASSSAPRRYQRLAELAVSTTARVELCRVREDDGSGGELVAVKRLQTAVATDPQFLAMFRDELWMAAHLKHENAVQVLDWGEDEKGPFLVMELVRGVSLQRLMRTVSTTREEFPERLVVYLGACIGRALAAAHALRAADGRPLLLVHRDLTPGNVLASFDGQVKITDFGLAKAQQRASQTITGVLKGDPDYMSPEQLRGEPLDGRADLFSFGVLLYELFTQRRPWFAATGLEGFAARLNQEPIELSSLRPRIDRNLVALVHRCLAKRPDDRPQTAGEVATVLADWLEAHRYFDSAKSLGRFVRRNAIKQMRWFERAVADVDVASVEPAPESEDGPTLINAFSDDLATASRAIMLDPARVLAAGVAPELLGSQTVDLGGAVTEPVTRRPAILGARLPGVVADPDPDAPSLPTPAAWSEDCAADSSTMPRTAFDAFALRELADRYAREAAEVAAVAAGAAAQARLAAAEADAAREALRLASEAIAAAASGDMARFAERLARAEALRPQSRMQREKAAKK